MAIVDPFISLKDWRLALYRGDATIVDRFLEAVEAELATGWVRDREYEQSRMRPDRTRCYLFDQAEDASVRVWLQRVTETRVRGGPIQVLRYPSSGDGVQIGRLVAELADGCVLPAAKAVGVRHSRPSFGPRSAFTLGAEMLFTRFADTADGEWPFTDRGQELWEELVSGCLTEQVSIDRSELILWLENSGWDRQAVPAIADRLFGDAAWLAKRLAATAP